MDGSSSDTAKSATRRSLRDWIVDTGLFLIAAAYGLAWAVLALDDSETSLSRLAVSQTIAGVACVALWLRRRWPTGLALVLAPVSAVFDLAAGAQLVALFTVAIHRPVKVTLAVGAAVLLCRPIAIAVYAARYGPPVDPPVSDILLYTATTTLAVIGWGLFIRHRRQLVLSLRDRAEHAEAEARLRAERAQQSAREQIAREMHDVLGHRLSLLSVHAGALEYRPDAPPEEVARTAGVIRESAHQALQDLREVIGVLRAPVGELPQPTLADVHQLVADSHSAGMRVELRERVTGTVPESAGRTAYRIVQEGLTNARKHAPRSRVEVSVSGAPGSGLSVEVRNTAADAAADAESTTGSGQGLIGLAERVSLAQGTLEYGTAAPPGGFRLQAWLPWPP